MNPYSTASLMQLLKAFVPHLPDRRKKQFLVLLTLMLIGAVAELISLGAVVPFVALMASPEKAFEYPRLQQFFGLMGWNRPESLLIPITLLFIALVIISTALRLLLTYVSNRFVFTLGFDVGKRLYDRVLHQPYSFHISRNTSEILASINKVQGVVSGVLVPLMNSIISVIIAIAILTALMVVNPLVTMAAGILFALFYLGVMRFMRTRLRKNSKIIASAQTQRVQMVQEGLGGIRHVLLDGSQSYYLSRFADVDQLLRKSQASNVFIGSAPRFLLEAIGIILIVGLAFVIATSSEGLIANLPALGALALGAQRLLPLFQQIYNGWSQALGNRQVFIDVLRILTLPDFRQQRSMGQVAVDFHKKIELRNLSFRYNESAAWVLQDLCLTIPQGCKVGFVGKTGSGKTTLIDVVMGLLPPGEGDLLVDDQAINDSNVEAWQEKIAHVPQMIFLSDATIAENIAFGIPSDKIDHQRVRECARRAHADEFIEALPRRFETHVGERGIQLSGGQRQRIAIARALYKRAELLVFDEATSALDNETEKSVMSFLGTCDNSLTILMIAHRLDSLRECDLVVRLEQGQVVQMGSFSEVIGSTSGVYPS